MDQEEGSRPPRRKTRNRSFFKNDRVEKREKRAQEKEAKKAFLTENLVFKRAKEDVKGPLSKISFAHGSHIAKRLSSFLRHGMKEGQYCKVDGSIELSELERSTGITAELILIAVSPAFDMNHKRRFLVIEKIYPGGQTIVLLAALGGHSCEVQSPPGHYQLGKESLEQLSPLVHSTSAVKEIQKSGFLMQQERVGGINLSSSSKAHLFRPKSSHVIEIDTKRSVEKGIVFFGNRFTDVFYCPGAWENGAWTGKVPLELLRISCRK